MQTIHNDVQAKADEETHQDQPQKDSLSKRSQTAVGPESALNTQGKEANIPLINLPNNITCLRQVTKSENLLVSNKNQKSKTRKNLRAKKRKKTAEEVNILEAYFKNDPKWGRKTVKALKSELPNLTVDQIYKWGYDKKLLLKKTKALEKATKAQVKTENIMEELNVPLDKINISDFNLEVDEICRADTGVSEELVGGSPATSPSQTSAAPTRRGSHLGSLDGKGTLPTAAESAFTVVEDDPFFYDRKDEAVFYVVINDSSKVIPHRRAGRRGLFRVPSGFVNMDFYTYKEEAFEKEGAQTFLGELYKDD